MNKIFSVVKTLFGTAAKKYPWFFVHGIYKNNNSNMYAFYWNSTYADDCG